jgi:type VI secretion system VasD/TssJ family lipoprotein
MLLKFSQIIFVVLVGIVLMGCESVKSAVGIKQSKVWLEKINFKAAANANDSSPIKIHVVIAYKDELAAELTKLDANAYFQKAKKLKADAGDDLDVFSIDVVPDSSASLDITPSSSTGAIALMFARYTSPGDHRTNVSADYEIQVNLEKSDLKVTPIKKG